MCYCHWVLPISFTQIINEHRQVELIRGEIEQERKRKREREWEWAREKGSASGTFKQTLNKQKGWREVGESERETELFVMAVWKISKIDQNQYDCIQCRNCISIYLLYCIDSRIGLFVLSIVYKVIAKWFCVQKATNQPKEEILFHSRRLYSLPSPITGIFLHRYIAKH